MEVSRAPSSLQLWGRSSIGRCKQQRNLIRCQVESNSSVSLHADRDELSESSRKRLAVFVSGGGSNFKSIHKATQDGTAHGEVVMVVSDKPECKGCDYARENHISVASYPKGKLAPDGIAPLDLVDALREQRVDYVLLAGYLKLIPQELVQAFPRAILNIHPALLPAFGGKGYYGMKVHEAVIASGARFSGPTMHFVDEKYDHGLILAQRIVPVEVNDTATDLAAKVLKEEHNLYVHVVKALCENRIEWRADGVPMIRDSTGLLS